MHIIGAGLLEEGKALNCFLMIICLCEEILTSLLPLPDFPPAHPNTSLAKRKGGLLNFNF